MTMNDKSPWGSEALSGKLDELREHLRAEAEKPDDGEDDLSKLPPELRVIERVLRDTANHTKGRYLTTLLFAQMASAEVPATTLLAAMNTLTAVVIGALANGEVDKLDNAQERAFKGIKVGVDDIREVLSGSNREKHSGLLNMLQAMRVGT